MKELRVMLTNSSNILTVLEDTDSYKTSHWRQYPQDTTRISSYIEARSGGAFPLVMVSGLQPILGALSKRITVEDVLRAAPRMKRHGVPFNRDAWMRIAVEFEGRLPVEVRAVAEGTVLPEGNAILQIVNTHDDFAWLPGWLEPRLLRAWYPITGGTQSWSLKQVIRGSLERTSDIPEILLPSRLHDFGLRGASCAEAAMLAGVAHLVNFEGTDNIPALVAAEEWYQEFDAGKSIPAMEHSTVTSWGRDGETAAYENFLDQYPPEEYKFIAAVSDSYDLFNAIRNIWGGTLKQKLLDRAARGGCLVVRPDSGDPVTMVLATIRALHEAFGAEENSKGFLVLHPAVRVIQGDGINRDSLKAILDAMEAAGYAADNIAFGMGGKLLQGFDRDTCRFAMKASARKDRAGQWHDVMKDPATDPTKRSKAGVLALVYRDGFQTIRHDQLAYGEEDYLVPVFRNGHVLRVFDLGEVRWRSEFYAKLYRDKGVL